MNYKILYSRCFNAITDEIAVLEARTMVLKKLQQELEEAYLDFGEKDSDVKETKK